MVHFRNFVHLSNSIWLKHNKMLRQRSPAALPYERLTSITHFNMFDIGFTFVNEGYLVVRDLKISNLR